MGLRFGKILLALSSPTQLEAMVADEKPYILPFSQEIKECLQESNCGKLVELIEQAGNILPFFSFNSHPSKARLYPCCQWADFLTKVTFRLVSLFPQN